MKLKTCQCIFLQRLQTNTPDLTSSTYMYIKFFIHEIFLSAISHKFQLSSEKAKCWVTVKANIMYYICRFFRFLLLFYWLCGCLVQCSDLPTLAKLSQMFLSTKRNSNMPFSAGIFINSSLFLLSIKTVIISIKLSL